MTGPNAGEYWNLGAEVKLFADKTDDWLQLLYKQLKELNESEKAPPTIMKMSAEWSTDASGNLGGGANGPGVVVFDVPVGFEAYLHRLQITAQGITATTPIMAGWAEFHRNGPAPNTLAYFLPISGVVCPIVITEGSNSAAQLLSGEQLIVFGAGLPASLPFYFATQWRLWRSERTG